MWKMSDRAVCDVSEEKLYALPQEQRDAARSLYLNGLRPRVIADRLGISPQAVFNWVTRYEWKQLRNKVADKLTIEVNEPKAKTLSESIREKLAIQLSRAVEALGKVNISSRLDSVDQHAAIQAKLAATGEKLFGWGSEERGVIVIGKMKPFDEPAQITQNIQSASDSGPVT